MTHTEATPTKGDTASPPSPKPARGARHDVVATLVATVVALLVVLLLPEAMGKDSPFVIGLAAYGSFLLALLITGRIRGRARAHATRTAASLVVPPAPALPPTAPDQSMPDQMLTDTNFLDLPALEQQELAGDDPTMYVPMLPSSSYMDFPDDQPMAKRRINPDALTDFGLAAAAALAIALLQHFVTNADGILGLVIVWYLGFMIVFYVIVRDRMDAEAATDRVVTTLVWSVGLLVLGVLAWMLIFLVGKGLPALNPGFFTDDLSQVGPLTPGGGAFHAIVGTVEQVGIATIVVVPISVLTAIYLHEIKGRLSKPVRFIVDAMSGLPSIVAGLLVFTVYVDGRGFSGIAGSMALIVLMIPTVTRAAEEILRTIPDALRESSLALGAPQWRVIMRVVVPTARAGLVTATILGIARAVGETAPMLLTAFGSDTTNWNPLKGPQSDLPLFVIKLYRVPNETQNQRAFTGLLVLVMLVLILFLTARAVANRGARKLGRAR